MNHEIIELERRFWLEGADFYRENTIDDCVMVFGEPVGALSKDEVLESISQGPRWATVKIEEPSATELVAGAVLLVYRAEAEQEDGTPYTTIASSIYVRDGDTWRLAFHQQSARAF